MRAWLIAGLSLIAGTANASLITIDPRGFLPGTDILTATPGVTLSEWGYSGKEAGYSSGPIHVDNCTPQYCNPLLEGQRIFSGEDSVWFGGTNYAIDAMRGRPETTFSVLRADFHGATNFVEIIGGGHAIEGGGDPLDLVAFDAHGNMLAKCLREFNCEKSLLSPSNPSEFTGLWKYTISLDLAEIATIVAGGTSASNRVASLTFATVPEPSTYALLVLGLVCMFVARRRRSPEGN